MRKRSLVLEAEQRQRDSDRARRAAGAAMQQGEQGPRISGGSGPRGSGGSTRQRITNEGEAEQRLSEQARVVSREQQQDPPLQGRGQGGRAIGGGESFDKDPHSKILDLPRQQFRQEYDLHKHNLAHQPQDRQEPAPPQAPAAVQSRSSFPHAFERWETLSAHWEGLTSFWIRRLEENSNEVNREPISQQLARQVTDLSAAGANLFHAVVELQRLRASSERKFPALVLRDTS